MDSSATMTSGGNITTGGIPSSTEFIPKPKYPKIEKPTLTKPTNDVINPLKVKTLKIYFTNTFFIKLIAK